MTDAIATVIAAVASAFLTGGVTLIVTLMNSKAQQKTYLAELEKQNALQNLRLEQLEKKVDQLEKKVDQPNHLDRRIVALEEQVKTLFNHVEGK